MSLTSFVDRFKIDLNALACVKKRLFVVGRFNQTPIVDDPEMYLFTNRDLSDDYCANFTHRFDLSYESFVQALRPAIAEQFLDRDPTKFRRFPQVLQVVPSGAKELQGASVIDTFNYFFIRATTSSDQKRFKKDSSKRPELLEQTDKDRGRAILTQIRRCLRTFCSFQPRSYEIVEAFAQMLGQCGLQHSLPSFSAGGPLPGGFREKLIDFIYAEDSRARFDPAGLDFSQAQWVQLRHDKDSLAMFCNVVSAFRDALLSTPAQQYNKYSFGNPPQRLPTLAKTNVSPGLAAGFREAREAFNSLRQILRSKVLLSMVLEWILSAFYGLDEVAEIPAANQDKRDRKVEGLILAGKKGLIAAPIKRPTPAERRRFSKLLTENFELLLKAILAPEVELKAALEPLPRELQDLAMTLRNNNEKRELLAGISGVRMGEEMHKSFMDAARTVLLDVLCPALYRNPIVTQQMLKKYFRRETMAAYLTAVFLGDSSQDAVRKIAEDHRTFFESKIDPKDKTLDDVDAILGVLLKDFMDVLSQPEMQRRLGEGMKVLHEVLALLEGTELEGQRGAGSISALLPFVGQDRKHEGSVEETPASRELIRVTVPQQVKKALEARLSSKHDNESQAPGSQPERGQDEDLGSPADSPTRLNLKINEILDKVVDISITSKEEATPEQVVEWTQKATAQILSDERLVGGLAEDLRAFERTLHLIYSRYEANPSLLTFRNKVERMTLINMMLLFQKDLGLGRVCSNLYQLLLDLVLHLDPDKVDPLDFLRENSLTVYFDDADLAEGGIRELRQTLEVQSIQSLNNIVTFVSELQGIKYLMDAAAPEAGAEVVVVNATATEFLEWLRKDNLTANRGKGRFRIGRLVTNDSLSEQTIPPGLVYLTDIAFPGANKEEWIKSLSSAQLRNGELRILLPPLCLSTPAQDQSGSWSTSGADWAAAAAEARAPIVIVGPSPHLNRPGDGFPTILPAGYVLGAHFLRRTDPQLRNSDSIAEASKGRFRVIGSGGAQLDESLDRVIWGEGGAKDYALSVDFYLYVLLLAWGTALRREGEAGAPDAGEFFSYFYHSFDGAFPDGAYRTSSALGPALLGHDAYRFALRQEVWVQDLQGVWLAPERVPANPSLLKDGALKRYVENVDWFNRARSAASLCQIAAAAAVPE